MPVIPFSERDFRSLYGAEIETQTLLDTLPMLGGDLDSVDGDAIAIEYFPDRPDLVSVEGIVRAMRAFTGIAPGLQEYALAEPDGQLVVEETVAEVRPWIVMCRVEGFGPLDDDSLKALMDFQERLGHGIGRRRRRVAIGIHDAAHVRGPYRYTTVDGDYRFHPLQAEAEMSVSEVLTTHPKGTAYAHLLPKDGPYPVILDADGHLLSLPPCINGTHTELKVGTTDLILDLTGPQLGPIMTAMAILVAAFAERGAKVIPFHVELPAHDAYGDQAGTVMVAPQLNLRSATLRVSETERVLGFGLDGKGIITCLERLGHRATLDAKNVGLVHVESPAWRADLLHEWDLIEDVAKGYGFANVVDAMPTAVSFGSSHPTVRRAADVRTALVGHGFLEATTLTISNERDQYDRFGLPRPDGDDAPVRVTNPITEDHTTLRSWLVPSLFQLLAVNTHRDYPQALFEVGQVVTNKAPHANAWRAAVVRADPKWGFTNIKGLAQALMQDLGVDAAVEEDDHPGFIAGRAARLVAPDGAVYGRFGEIHPRVLEAFEVKVPAVALELDLDVLRPITA